MFILNAIMCFCVAIELNDLIGIKYLQFKCNLHFIWNKFNKRGSYRWKKATYTYIQLIIFKLMRFYLFFALLYLKRCIHHNHSIERQMWNGNRTKKKLTIFICVREKKAHKMRYCYSMFYSTNLFKFNFPNRFCCSHQKKNYLFIGIVSHFEGVWIVIGFIVCFTELHLNW